MFVVGSWKHLKMLNIHTIKFLLKWNMWNQFWIFFIGFKIYLLKEFSLLSDFNIIKYLRPTQFKLPNVILLNNYFADQIKVWPSDKLNNEMKLQLKNFKRNHQSKVLQIRQCSWSNNNIMLDISENISEPQTKKRKSFSERNMKMMWNCNDELLTTLTDFTASENEIISINNMMSFN